jgi:hypothetical protein
MTTRICSSEVLGGELTSISSLRPDFVIKETSSLSAASAEVLKLIVVVEQFR